MALKWHFLSASGRILYKLTYKKTNKQNCFRFITESWLSGVSFYGFNVIFKESTVRFLVFFDHEVFYFTQSIFYLNLYRTVIG